MRHARSKPARLHVRGWALALLLFPCASGEATADTVERPGLESQAGRRVARDPLDIVRPLPRGALGPGGGCLQFLAPPDGHGPLLDRAILSWPFAEAKPGADDAAGRPIMNIGGRVTPVIPLTARPEDLFGRPRKGATFTEVYRRGALTLTFRNTITFVCPPTDESCEVTRFRGTLHVSDGDRTRVHRTQGECGF